MLVDSHCHLDFPDFADDLDGIVARAEAAGIGRMVTISTRVKRLGGLLAITERFPDVYCSVGTHPHHADEEDGIPASELIELTKHPKVVALGEAGLDYFYEHGSREAQERGFRAHIAAARATGLPLVIHTREADEDCGRILEDEVAKGPFKAVLHCYTGGRELAMKAIALGLSISFTGILTFKKSDALRALAEELNAPHAQMPDPGPRPQVERGAPTPEGLARTVAALMPEGAIIVDEAVSYGRGFFPHTHASPKHDWLQITGGAIGCGVPLATGAAIGGGGRRVIALQADGSALYTVQGLWTQAREKLPVTTIILSNRKYQILIGEYQGVGANPGPTAMNMLNLSDPEIGWVKLAEAMGVEAAQATTLGQVADLMAHSIARTGPFLIELVI